ncbi:MAG: rRNA pseudouridine synthase [Firmicutes bacterium]|nr:rRNA pseudouridine synthase [Bacillota bacterium]
MAAERLQKFLARAGIGSRRACEQLISQGRVRVNGRLVTEQGLRVDPERDKVQVDGRVVKPSGRFQYIMLNKPAGYVTTVRDPQGRPTVMHLLPERPRVFPVGRLDRDTEGLLLLTNDGELAYRLAHPRFQVEKRYRALVRGEVGPEAVRRLENGVVLDDGPTAPCRVRVIRREPERTLLELRLREGRKRQVRRMCEAVGHPVVALMRIAVGPVLLGRLPKGAWRPLTPEEIAALRGATGLD